jgi:hypothetical protein
VRRILKSAGLGLLALSAVELFLRISPHTALPPILDYLLAPGLIPLVLFLPCGPRPPGELEAYLFQWLWISRAVDFTLYSLIAWGIVWMRSRQRLRLP